MANDTASHVDRSVDYIELASTDLEATRRFYGAAFGWSFTEYGPDYMGYHDGPRERRPKEAGGFRREATVTRGGPLVILYADDLEAARARVVEAGGTIVTDIFSFPGGRRFHFADPSGNELAVWSER